MKRLRSDMYACGEVGLPPRITCSGLQWRLVTVFKHDFFACTGKYQSELTQEECVLKVSRLQPFFGIPLDGVGQFLRNRELNILRRLQDIDQVPHIIKPYGCNGLLYRLIEGQSLDERPTLPDDFFGQLRTLLQTIHQRNICYIDMNKRGNILVGKDGRPFLIDFQISLHLPATWCGFLRRALQREDNYHLLKHNRKLRPDLLTPEEMVRSRKPSILIRVHRVITHPYRQLRRALLRSLYKAHILTADSASSGSPENNPRRFLR
ncbi:MAG: hypothetical protein L0Y36_06235 [Planctomycetales bacterium]|nr:hypothetical protein [Planctomycetales bacterium]